MTISPSRGRAPLKGRQLIAIDTEISHDTDEQYGDDYYDDSFTATTITFKTDQDTVISRWHGSSNGYYSESVDFAQLK